MINKYGNDWKNNIWWNKEYPFIPKITNDNGFTIHEDDIVEFYRKADNKCYAARVCKIYNKDLIWVRYERHRHDVQIDLITTSNDFYEYKGLVKKPEIEDLANQGIWNHFEDFLGSVYARLYADELSLPNDCHFDDEKYEAKRLEEVRKLKYGN